MAQKHESDVPDATVPDDRRAGWALTQIEKALRGLQFGHVSVIVQDGVVVQVERTERHRFQRRSSAS